MSLPEAEQVALGQQMANASTSVQLSPAGLWIPSWGWDLSGDTVGTKIHHQMLKYSTGAYFWWIIRQSPDLLLWGGGLCRYRLCAGNWLTPWWEPAHTSPSDTSSSPLPISSLHFHTSWQEQSLFLHCCPPFPQDSFRNKTGKANHPQTNRVFVLCTTRCPSATIYLFPLIQSLLPYREQNYKAVLQYQTHHLLRPTLASSGSWQTTASHLVLESAPPPAWAPPRDAVPDRQFHWQGGIVYISPIDMAGGCPAQPPPAALTGWAGLCRSAFQKQKVRGHTWRCCEGHHPIVGKSTSFKLHPLFPSLHFHFPLLRKRRESCN